MTAELRWIFLLLHFTAAAAELNMLYVTVRDGDDVTLPCYAGTDDQRRRDDTVWIFIGSGSSSVVTVFKDGKFDADVRSKSDRLRVTEKCSLVIEKVSVNDAGQYTCRQFNTSGRQQGETAVVLLSVVTMTEQKVGGDDDDEVTLTCSVRSYGGRCEHSVQWLFDDEDKNMKTSQFSCSDSVKIKTSEFNQKKKSLRCKVRDHHGNTEKLFEFKTQRSTGVWWVYLLVGVASMFLVVVVVWFLIRQKKKKTSEIEPEADPEGVAYVSVSFAKTTRTRDQVKGHDDDDDDAVTYSTVRAPPPSSSSDVYATVNKPKK